ncbi:MAG: mannose-1-phosphate guanylyltransferase [Myxococcales bacterium]|nr:mannose-1-phosphate guanylyltransferase [Myxococcota bacterium]MDW8281029.1 mannose-1-phosphate guanylyltransferase [Myxococcales bacterium]
MDIPDHTFVVIMAGGGGTRLWPLSRRCRPKQFLPILPDGQTLLGASLRRCAALCPPERTLVVTTADQVAQVRRCAPHLPIDNLIVEPVGRNTAPCIGLSALAVLARDPQGLMAVVPADHFVQDEAAWLMALQQALATAAAGHIVAVGIRPHRPETGYGYIQLGPETAPGVHLVEAFVEKPDAERATAYVQSGAYLWNAGMFFFPARRILQEIERHLPPLGAILDELRTHPSRTAARYPEAPAISIDYAVMEQLGRARVGQEAAIRVVPASFGWNDVGSFPALCALHPPDRAGNHIVAAGAPPPLLSGAHHNLVVAGTRQLVAAADINGLIIVVTDDVVLVLPAERAQQVRSLVELAQQNGWSEYL